MRGRCRGELLNSFIYDRLMTAHSEPLLLLLTCIRRGSVSCIRRGLLILRMPLLLLFAAATGRRCCC